MFWRSKPSVNGIWGILILACCELANAESEPLDMAHARRLAMYAPRPEYPLVARQHHWTGAGVFQCNIRPNGTVSSVKVLQSTGHDMLDQAGIAAFGQWRFKPGVLTVVKIPLRFTMSGSGVRHRMSGAVIPD
jgi:TonB family protein